MTNGSLIEKLAPGRDRELSLPRQPQSVYLLSKFSVHLYFRPRPLNAINVLLLHIYSIIKVDVILELVSLLNFIMLSSSTAHIDFAYAFSTCFWLLFLLSFLQGGI